VIPSVTGGAEVTPRATRGISPLHLAIGMILTLFAAKHVVTALVFPPFTGHDEVAHYGYLRTVALEKRLPTLSDPMPESASKYRAYALDWSWGSGYQYTALHPPLYYLAMAPIVALDPSAAPEQHLFAVRLAGVWIGVLTILLAVALAQTVFPGDAFMAVTTAVLVAFQPQVSYEAAIVNNDALGIAATSLVLWLLARAIRDGFSTRRSFEVGAALGVALLAKSTALVLVPALALAIVLSTGRSPQRWVQAGLAMSLAAVVISFAWYAHLYRVYGDFSGLAQLATLQAHWNRPAGTFVELLFSTSFLVERFRETWGEFGWRRAPLDAPLLWSIGIASAIAGAGLLRFVLASVGLTAPREGDRPLQPWQRAALLVLFCATVAGYLAVVQFGTRFVLTQARYFFPIVNAAALLAAVGIRELTHVRYRRVVQALLLVVLAMLNLLIYTRAVIPAWHFPR
jgi:4-amino-4-deoxy-L-arabinose transferase-like glycosyltransferase